MKNKKTKLNIILLNISILLCAIIFIAMAFDGAKFTISNVSHSESVYSAISQGLAVDVIALVILIISILTLVFLLIYEIHPFNFKIKDAITVILVLLMVVMGIMFFCTAVAWDKSDAGYSLGIGARFASINSFLSAIVTGMYCYENYGISKKSKKRK